MILSLLFETLDKIIKLNGLSSFGRVSSFGEGNEFKPSTNIISKSPLLSMSYIRIRALTSLPVSLSIDIYIYMNK